MPCFSPNTAYRSRILNPSGKRSMVFDLSFAIDNTVVKLPCGKCEGCLLRRARNWAIRCMHEASMYEDSCFITLTYRNEDLPAYGSLRKRDFQLFFKRLRKRYGKGARYYHCGEYGAKLGRPHYHALLFNFNFNRTERLKTHSEFALYRSSDLEQLWPHGHSSVGSCTFKSAGYVARYVMKKVNGSQARLHYDTGYHDFDTGEVILKSPEYTTMSRRPGIGKIWFDKYYSDVYPHDNVVVNGLKFKPPKYYDDKYALIDPSGMDEIRALREAEAFKQVMDNTIERLAVKRKLVMGRLGRLPRRLDLDQL